MKSTALKKKLKDDFEKIIDDESNLETLNTVFSKIIIETENSSEDEIKSDPKVKKTEVRSWEDFKMKMKAKYGY